MANCLPTRASGVLLHVTSLPGRTGIGELGADAHRFIDWLASAGQRYWQVLPLGPTGYGESPYQLLSSYAGNPLLISLEALGYPDEAYSGDPERVDFAWLSAHKQAALQRAIDRFVTSASATERAEVESFIQASPWLDDYALFMSLKRHFKLLPWHLWPQPFAAREPEALAAFARDHAADLYARKLEQYWFHQQWQALRKAAADAGIRIIGDCPIYVAHDSCEVWCARELFDLQPNGEPATIAGVPPDYFSATGQRWGNPLYQWARHAADGFAWWRARLAHSASLFDLIRLDHFRGFDAYWSIPASCPTAEEGSWLPGPGVALFDALGDLPLIAEDLGLLTDSVHALRDTLGLPGMRVLQFGFDGEVDNPHAPANIGVNVVCYTGTHDNDTTRGWFTMQNEDTRARVLASGDIDGATSALIDLAMASSAQLVILPMQDILDLGSWARFNTPGVIGGNWQWRVTTPALTAERAAALARKTGLFQRSN